MLPWLIDLQLADGAHCRAQSSYRFSLLNPLNRPEIAVEARKPKKAVQMRVHAAVIPRLIGSGGSAANSALACSWLYRSQSITSATEEENRTYKVHIGAT